MKNEISKFLRTEGLVKLASSTFWCDAGELVHVVSMFKDRYGSLVICFKIWHSSFVNADRELKVAAIQSPVMCNFCPTGLDENWSWDCQDAFNIDSFKKAFFEFFSVFSKMDDIRKVLETYYVSPFYSKRLESLVLPAAVVCSGSRPRYSLTGKSLSLIEAQLLASCHLADIASCSTFEIEVAERGLLATRNRGGVIECIKIVIGPFQTSCALRAFIWTKVAWQADKRLKGSFIPIKWINAEFPDGELFSSISGLASIDVSIMLRNIESALDKLTSIVDAATFASFIAGSFGTLSQAILRIEAKRRRS